MLAGLGRDPGEYGWQADHIIATALCPPSVAMCNAVYGNLISMVQDVVDEDRAANKARLWVDARGATSLHHLATVFVSGVALFHKRHPNDPAWLVYSQHTFFKTAEFMEYSDRLELFLTLHHAAQMKHHARHVTDRLQSDADLQKAATTTLQSSVEVLLPAVAFRSLPSLASSPPFLSSFALPR